MSQLFKTFNIIVCRSISVKKLAKIDIRKKFKSFLLYIKVSELSNISYHIDRTMRKQNSRHYQMMHMFRSKYIFAMTNSKCFRIRDTIHIHVIPKCYRNKSSPENKKNENILPNFCEKRCLLSTYSKTRK